MTIQFGSGKVCFVLVLFSAVPSLATVYTVGDAAGWNLGSSDDTWANGKTFKVGDSLVFNYLGGLHTVDEVTKSDYESCTPGNSLSSDSSGSTTILLVAPGTRYFICSTSGHCDSGMKLAVPVTGPPATPLPPPTVVSPPNTLPPAPVIASPPSTILPPASVPPPPPPPATGSPPEKDSAVAKSPFMGMIVSTWVVIAFFM